MNVKKNIIERINTSQFKYIELETTEKSEFVKISKMLDQFEFIAKPNMVKEILEKTSII